MKPIKKLIPYLIIAILALIILYQEGCFGKKKGGDTLRINGKDYEVIKHEIDTFYETKTETVYRKGKDITHEVEVVKEIPANVDTASILKDYYARVFYNDTFKLKDTLGYIAINDTISKNRIVGRKFHSAINIPTIKETLYLKEISNNWYIGPSVQLGIPFSVGGDLHLKSKKDMLFGLGMGINSNISPYLRGSVSWKIK
jgi:hypothetical protein